MNQEHCFLKKNCRDYIPQQLNKSLPNKEKNKQINYHIRLDTSVSLTLDSALHSPTSPQPQP
jgi:hypothetical protein